MLGRLFGRSKEDHDETVCSMCGRTLLAGEWTQRLVDDDGRERYVCALCARPAESVDEPSAAQPADPGTVTNDRVKPARADSDVFWRAIKEKDVEIERLESRLARSEAEKQELAAQLAALQSGRAEAATPGADATTPETPAPGVEAPVAAPQDGWDDAGSETVEIPPDEVEQLLAAPADEVGPAPVAGAPPAVERTDPGLGEALRAAQPGEAFVVAGFENAADDASGSTQSFEIVTDDGALTDTPPAVVDEDELVPLTILQRGVDLLNVSAVPRRIVETNESLGMPQVHVGSQTESSLLATFMWSMGWYQFCVDLADGGHITLADRGYEERTDLLPNASVRADGTVQLAPTQIKPPTPRDTSDAKPVGVTSGVIISKSMMGQRTDDENVPADWKTQRAPDFDWGR